MKEACLFWQSDDADSAKQCVLCVFFLNMASFWDVHKWTSCIFQLQDLQIDHQRCADAHCPSKAKMSMSFCSVAVLTCMLSLFLFLFFFKRRLVLGGPMTICFFPETKRKCLSNHTSTSRHPNCDPPGIWRPLPCVLLLPVEMLQRPI